MIQDDLSSTFVDPTLLTDLDSPTKPSCLGRGVFHTAKGQNSIPGGKGCGLECKPNGPSDIWGDESEMNGIPIGFCFCRCST